mgnify:CR=1 FL=1
MDTDIVIPEDFGESCSDGLSALIVKAMFSSLFLVASAVCFYAAAIGISATACQFWRTSSNSAALRPTGIASVVGLIMVIGFCWFPPICFVGAIISIVAGSITLTLPR